MSRLNKSRIHKILVISLSNIGDVVLTLPVTDILRRDFPDSKISMVVGPKAESLLKNSSVFETIHIYNKRQPVLDKFRWILQLRREKYNLVVDLRNSMIPFLLSSKYHTPLDVSAKQELHMRDKHLVRLKSIHAFDSEGADRNALSVSADDVEFVNECLTHYLESTDEFVVMAPGSADEGKRWSKQGFAEVADFLIKSHGLKVIFLGDDNDRAIAQAIQKLMDYDSVNLCGRTNLIQTTEVIRRAKMALVNDSALLHIASYLNVPVMAVFGYTDPKKYGPWSKIGFYLKSKGTGVTKESPPEQRVKMIESIPSGDVMACIKFVDGTVQLG